MDATQIGIVASSISVAKDIAKAMVGIRDHNLVAEKVAALTDQLLKAQEALLAHNTAMFELQNEHFEAREKLREVEKALSEKGRYTLIDLGRGYLAYRVDAPPEQGGAADPSSAEAPHYVCQQCFDAGRKSVLQPLYQYGVQTAWTCHVCKAKLFPFVTISKAIVQRLP